MSNSIKILVALGVVALASACNRPAPQDDVVFVEPAPIQAEPSFNKF